MSAQFNCLVVDDEPLAAEIIEQHIQKIPQLNCVGTCWNVIEAFKILKQEQIDLIFLDIQMPEINGVEFVKSMSSPIDIIFTTAYRDYAVESYELNVVDYLLKPITFSRFFKSVMKFLDQNEAAQRTSSNVQQPPEQEEYVFVSSQRKQVKILFSEVLYIESLKDYIHIHLFDKTVSTKETISLFSQKLPSFFLRVHRSFIVNIHQVSAYSHHNIEIKSDEIPIGVSYKKAVMEKLENL